MERELEGGCRVQDGERENDKFLHKRHHDLALARKGCVKDKGNPNADCVEDQGIRQGAWLVKMVALAEAPRSRDDQGEICDEARAVGSKLLEDFDKGRHRSPCVN